MQTIGHRVKSVLFASATLALLAANQGAAAAPVVIDFDAFPDLPTGLPITTQIPGVTFVNALKLTAGSTLNEVELPPRSGTGVVIDDSGALSISFAAPVFSVGAYFTYYAPLTFSVFNSSNVLLTSVLSLFGDNSAGGFGDLGSSPNELLAYSDAAGQIARVVIAGSPGGSSFAMDDLTVDFGATVPEPQTLALVLGLLGAGCAQGGWLRRRNPA